MGGEPNSLALTAVDFFFRSKWFGPCWPSIVANATPPQGKSPKGGASSRHARRYAKGGDTGPAVVPGDLDASLLLKAVNYGDGVLKMPPKGKLPQASIAALAQWVKDGAVVPHDIETAHAKQPPGLDFESARSHWAYQPIRRPAVPAVHRRDWSVSPIDSFVLAALEVAGLAPSPRSRSCVAL